jgi:hypothetical protein
MLHPHPVLPLQAPAAGVAAGGADAAASAAEAGGPPAVFDENEPRYCLCDKPAYGEMVGCDNDSCAREWFHLACVGLKAAPSGSWYCPPCRAAQAAAAGRKSGGGRGRK